MSKKDPKKLIADAEKQGMPSFTFVAKDKLATEALQAYWVACDSERCAPEHIVGIQQIINEFEAWQRKNLDKVKLPD